MEMAISTIHLFFFFLSLTSIFITSTAADTLSATQSIRHGDATIVSAGGIFELGFFRPGDSQNRYLGIWYKKISAGTVVWVANRKAPVVNSTGILKFNERGNLVLLNQENLTLWNSSMSRVVKNPVAQLLDSGNLVIRDGSDSGRENFLWQSFHYPDNTFLPGMKIGRLAEGFVVNISSWTNSDDPSRGSSTYQVDSSGLQTVITRSLGPVRSGPWTGISFSGMPYLKPNPIFNYEFISNEKEAYYTYELVNGSVFTRFVLNENGVLQQFGWNDRTKDWTLMLAQPVDNCDNYALCGPHGSCDISNSPVCWCLKGFVPKSGNDWARADWTGGCVRRTPLDCGNGDGFVRYPNVKLPDLKNSSINASMTLEECRMTCLKNCSCMAYASSNSTGNGGGCFFWFGELIDIKLFKDVGGQDLYIRMAASELDVEKQASSNSKRKVVIIVCVISLTGIFLIVLGLGLFIRKKKRKKKQNIRGRRENIPEEYSIDKNVEDIDLPYYEFRVIANATDNFSFNNLLGEGGFGPVYKGLFKDGHEIAVKRLSKHSKQGLDEFKNEVKCIAKLQHRNLVKLLGYCIQLEEKMLIYEYMPNKSLDHYIFDETRGKLLDWNMRFRIINGVSRGLLYLHQDSRLRIIHRDLKLSNILLDSDMNPKISDFGMAKSFWGNETEANTKRVVGTYGYMSPEYAIDGIFSVKSDVFSFGVLVLEIISGKRNRGFVHTDHQLNLLGHTWQLFKEGRSLELTDAALTDSCNLSEVLRSIHVGLLCVQQWPKDRPSMSSVVLMLSGEGVLPEPKEPGFFTKRKLIEDESYSSKQESHDSCSVNEVTITMLEVR